ncbi:MAG: HEAT repeat domain-containing protein [Planctomycetia bacterium]|nr:HEAT repeat domain-containing protein [Planctomycetia bacterium]
MPRLGLCRCAALLSITTALLAALLLHEQRPAPAADPVPVPFTVPPGFVVERVAGAPLVEHPVMAGFDDQGRLYVAESAGLNLKAPELLKQLPDSIRRLEDTNGDGVFDKATVFADKMTFPMGALWHRGAVYTCSPPSFWKLEDTDGDGVADQRTELLTGFRFIGNAADIHGPFLSPDGRIYFADGRHGHQIDRPEGDKLQGKAARIFRCRPDGRDLEGVCGGGMDNPVEVAFTPEGESFATVDILVSRPRNDAIIHCIEGGVFPYHDALKELKSTGDVLPPVTFLGWVAPSGLMSYRGGNLGADYRDNLFSTQFNTHKVQRHILERDGATFKAKNEDFLTARDPDFHPTDVLEDADGSLLVIDTGGWFRIGCPTSQIAKPEVKGAIYRVRKQGAERVADPWGKQLAWNKLPAAELVKLLDDGRWAVRDRAIERLAAQGNATVPVLKQVVQAGKTVQARRNAVWALNRIETAEARAGVRLALGDTDASVRNAAAHAAGLQRDAEALSALAQAVVKDDSPAVRRSCATGLGRLRKAEAVPALLAALRGPTDRFLEHALIYALIEIGSRDAILPGLSDPQPQLRRAALIALGQMINGNLTREQVLPLLETDDGALQQTVLTTVIARPEWASHLVEFLRGWLLRAELSEQRQDVLKQALVAFSKDRDVQGLVAESLRQERTPTLGRLLLLETIAQTTLDKLPPDWLTELGRSLNHPEERVARQAVATVRGRNLKDFDGVLETLAEDRARPAELRVAALGAAAPRLSEIEPALFDFVLTRLQASLPALDRLAAASALAPAKLSDAQLETLGRSLAVAGALEVPHLAAPFERSKSPNVGRQFLAALDKSPGLTSLSGDGLRKLLQGYPSEIQQAAKPILAKLEVDSAQQQARLKELDPVLTGGDAKRGRAVFFGNKAACSSCHQVKGEGAQTGPDLSTIGAIRTGRDLLEAIVFPSASFVRGYEPFVVANKDGKIVNGILRRETADAVFVMTAERNEIRIARTAIDSIDPGKISIMPQGLDTQLNRQELTDLIAYLLTLK